MKRDKILRVLFVGALSLEAVAREIQIDEDTTKAMLDELCDEGLVMHIASAYGDDSYVLSLDGETVAQKLFDNYNRGIKEHGEY